MLQDRVCFGECVAAWSADALEIGNGLVSRRWRVANGLLYAVSLRDATGREWLSGPSERPVLPAGGVPDEPRAVTITARQGRATPVAEEALHVEVTAAGASLTLTYRFTIYPGVSAVWQQLTGSGSAWPAVTASEEAAGDIQEAFTLAVAHPRLRQVTLFAQTDRHNELARETAWLLHPSDQGLALSGNLFILEDSLAGGGLMLLKHAPLPPERPREWPADLCVGRVTDVALSGHGAGEDGAGYPWAVIVYSGGEAGRIAALHRYQRAFRRYNSRADGLVLANTWGDRSRDSRVCETFIRAEIDAAARLGADIIQIDDGWQQGRTGNSAQAGGIMEDFWRTDPRFWEPHPARFPNGLTPLAEEAARRGLRLGLWFNPDSGEDFAHWASDADAILRLHRELGVCFFKIDGVTIRSKVGEANFQRFIDRVMDGSAWRITLDLDITAGRRPGYYGLMDTGPLFLENRYTDWVNYWPHHTLRNLWTLAHYVDPLRLRMEWLNRERNTEKYAGDPLAPVTYQADYLFATVMCSSPLAWFEVSNLPAADAEGVARLIAVWRDHREAFFSGDLLPIGEQPDGTAWTGFVSTREQDGFLLLFRERNERPTWTGKLPAFPGGKAVCTLLAGEGTACICNGKLKAAIPDQQRFLFARVRMATEE